MKKLPKKPSALLKLALTDVEAVEAMKNVEFDMNEWLTPADESGICTVCVAGAVMLNTCNLKDMKPEWFQYEQLPPQFQAINEFRVGNLVSTLNILNIELPKSLPDDYNNIEMNELSRIDREEWKLHMCTIIGMLEAEGL